MKIVVVGTGYVGLVSGTCFAERGNQVTCVDIDESKIQNLHKGILPIYEPGLDELVKTNYEEKRLSFSTSLADVIDGADLVFIAVGTPPGEDGSADLQYVLGVASDIGKHMTDYAVIVDKSTVPVGTADKVTAQVQAELDKRGLDITFDVASNPEFLKEGAAIGDFMKPDRIIVGTDNPRTTELLRTLYEPFNRSHDRMISMDIRSAELTKYAANAMLATKISFMNELAGIAERMGADIEVSNARDVGGEPVADVTVRSAPLHGIDIPVELVPLAIDEFPVLFVAAACAEGETVLTGAKELRVKESDRIQVMADGLLTLGVDAQPTEDGMVIRGGGAGCRLGAGQVESHDDHRIAMAFSMAALRANGPVVINNCANVNTSFPDFVGLARGAGLLISDNSSDH